jgi:hypothetical protein
MSGVFILGKGNLIEDFGMVKLCQHGRWKEPNISIVNAELFPIALIVWSGAIRSGWCNFPSILVTVYMYENIFKMV